jgi:hypothetical protein
MPIEAKASAHCKSGLLRPSANFFANLAPLGGKCSGIAAKQRKRRKKTAALRPFRMGRAYGAKSRLDLVELQRFRSYRS